MPRALFIRAECATQPQHELFLQVDLRHVEPRLEDFLLTEILFKAGARKIAFDAKILIKMMLRSLPSLSMDRISGILLVSYLVILGV